MTLDPDAALAWVEAGCSVIPIKADGTKAPDGPWKAAMHVHAAPEAVAGYAATHDGIGVVCGAVSGNLEMFELEGRAIAEGLGLQLREACRDNGIEPLLDTIMEGCRTRSPSGGFHFWFRVDGDPRRNTKLARRPATEDELAENPQEKVKVLIETRGEGGFAVVPPSGGRVHPTGKPWTIDAGGPATIPVVSAEDRDALHAVASLLDLMPVVEQPSIKPAAVRDDGSGKDDGSGLRPGDDFNQRATWDEILIPHGWTRMRALGQGYTWRRPGKNDPGISATTGQAKDADRLYVFSSSTDFEPERAYSKFAAHALLEFGGDYSAASRDLRRRGYGDQTERSRESPMAGLIPPGMSTPPMSDGNLALVHNLDERRDEQSSFKSVIGVELHRGELRMAERLAIRHSDGLRFAHGIGWHCWDDARWRPDDDGEPSRKAIDTIKASYMDLTTLRDDARKDLWKDLNRVESSAGMAGMLKLASNIIPIATSPSKLDADPHLFNLPGGTLQLLEATVRPHDRMDLITHVAGANIGDERNAEWDTFIQRILPDDDVRAFVQRLFGYAMLGRVTEHVMPIFTGTGANGKGTLRDAVLAAFGDYALEVDPRILMESKHERHSTELMELRGRRLIFCSETEKTRRFAEATMKRLTGGEPIQARRMHKDPITFLPSHTLVMMTNHLPAVAGDDPAVWRRILVVPFDVVIPAEERDGELPERLRTAAPAVLRWVLDGWLEYQRDGLAPPPAVQARTEAYRADSDTLGRFVSERCMVNPNAHVKARDLYSAYVQWCNSGGEHAVTEKDFAKSMEVRGQAKARSKTGQIYRGIGLYAEADDVEA